MKAIITLALFVVCSDVAAQLPVNYYRFPEAQPISIEFYPERGVTATIKLRSWDQLDSIHDLSALLNRVRNDLKPVWDTVYKAGYSHKIFYHDGKRSRRFFVTSFPQTVQGFVIDSTNQVSNVKSGVDSLYFNFFTTASSRKPHFVRSELFSLTLTFRSLQNLDVITNSQIPEALDSVIARLKSTPSYTSKPIITGTYDSTKKNFSVIRMGQISSKKVHFLPDIYAGFQFVRGEWVTSAAAGFQVMRGNYGDEREEFKLLWEPHFSFSVDGKGKRKLYRDDFISFRYYSFEKSYEKQKVSFPLFFSAGYLVRNKGSVYEKNTFKFSLPGLQYMGATLEPEFFFNDLLRNFSPSIKLNYHFE